MEISSGSFLRLGGQQKDSTATEVSSDILKSAERAQVQASADLLVNLRQMLNEPSFSDVVFLCKDGERVHASRLLLAGRSDVLKGMFMSGMAESNVSEIKLPEISSPVLLAVFEFLYTGTLLEYHPQSWRMACEVIIASRFFLLPNLEMITRKFMHKQASDVAEDLPMVASMLSEAVEFNSLCDQKDVNFEVLVKILSSNWSNPVYIPSLSEDAFHYLLASSKGLNSVNDDKLSFKEYFRFRQVIRWWIYQSSDADGSPGEEELLNFIAPNEKRALSLCRHPDRDERIENPLEDARFSNEWSSFRLDEPSLRSSAIRLLSNVDFRWIHPALLAKVVEPLKIIASADLLTGFRFHALRRPMIFSTLEYGWKHGESHGTREEGYVIHKVTSNIGLAVMTAAMSSSYVMYQWRFIIEETPSDFCELGIMYDYSGMGAKKPRLEGEKLSDVWQARVLDGTNANAWCNWRDNKLGPFGWKDIKTGVTMDYYRNIRPPCLEKGSKVAFHFNSYERTCSVIIDNTDFGIVWRDLPKAISYPAVSLGRSSTGCVRIELLSGFNIL